MPWHDKDKWDVDELNCRYSGKYQHGQQGNGKDPTPYRMCTGHFRAGGYSIGVAGVDVPNFGPIPTILSNGASAVPHARNKSWQQMIGRVRDGPAQLGVAIAEWRQAYSMIESRSLQALALARAARHGDVSQMLKILGYTRKWRPRKSVKEFSDLWLEFSFGWSPLLKDVYTGLDQIGKPLPTQMRVFGKGSEVLSDDGYSHPRYSLNAVVRQGLRVDAINPNLYLAQQFGIANPAAIAWELVPYSFVVDWVFDVGTCLNGMTDLLGVSYSYPFTLTICAGPAEGRAWYDGPFGPIWKNQGKLCVMRRDAELSYPFPNVSIRANIGNSWKRAANAVSLLGQALAR